MMANWSYCNLCPVGVSWPSTPTGAASLVWSNAWTKLQRNGCGYNSLTPPLPRFGNNRTTGGTADFEDAAFVVEFTPALSSTALPSLPKGPNNSTQHNSYPRYPVPNPVINPSSSGSKWSPSTDEACRGYRRLNGQAMDRAKKTHQTG